ncbi:MAG: GDP-mannose 4,6-dehydratase [bacterium]|nr:GDP-mannose 4,6-dehydratase [bacterium]
MKRILITGAEGFVASYLSKELTGDYELAGGYFIKRQLPYPSFFLDVTDYKAVEDVLNRNSYDAVFHLAGQSSAKVARVDYYETYRINVQGALNLAEAIAKNDLKTRLIFISTSDVYGIPLYLPIDEKHPLSPQNAYSHSKKMAEEILLKYTEKGLDLVIARSFNHTGVGQTNNFFIPSIIEQVKNTESKGIIRAGDLSIARDFSDVRDIAKAYRELIHIQPSIYNISSGNAVKLIDIAEYIIKKSSKEISIVKSKDLVRHGEPKEFYGSSDVFRKITGWKSEYSVFDTIDWMMNNV